MEGDIAVLVSKRLKRRDASSPEHFPEGGRSPKAMKTATLLAAMVALTACDASTMVKYTPESQDLSRLTTSKSRAALVQLNHWYFVFNCDVKQSYACFPLSVRSIRFSGANMEVSYDGDGLFRPGGVQSLNLRSATPGYMSIQQGADHDAFLIFDQRSGFRCDCWRVDDPTMQNMVDALFVLKRAALEESASEGEPGEFEATARAYRSANPKPALPEGAHRYMVEAETAVRNKQFDMAAGFYEQAIEVAPWNPPAHFNRALVLGKQQEYDDAIREMKRYLSLAPDAPDARAAQDQIYSWESEKTAPPAAEP